MNLRGTKKIVERILNSNPMTRGNDSLLIIEVYEYISPGITQRTFKEVVPLGHEDGVFPPFETIRRARQKIQAENPYLKPPEEIQSLRMHQQHKFFEFSLKGR